MDGYRCVRRLKTASIGSGGEGATYGKKWAGAGHDKWREGEQLSRSENVVGIGRKKWGLIPTKKRFEKRCGSDEKLGEGPKQKENCGEGGHIRGNGEGVTDTMSKAKNNKRGKRGEKVLGYNLETLASSLGEEQKRNDDYHLTF